MRDPGRYSGGAMILHWAIALAVIVSWRLAESAEHAPRDQEMAAMAPHMATGILILALTLVRLIWRLANTQPPFPPGTARWEAALARVIHFTFYVLLLGLPVMGWIGTSMQREAIDFFGLFTLPSLPTPSDEHGGHDLLELHATAGEIFIYLIGLHILGALKHHLWDRNGELYRMLPFGRVKTTESGPQ